ncbi:hypothetical protein SGRIM128S_05648 [Streptomyces griseomycini]
MDQSDQGDGPAAPSRRKDARRNKEALLDAAAAVFVESGVDAPVREIAARAGVGLGTLYRHFPTRADLIIAVYRHQVDACAEAGPALLATSATPHAALGLWIDRFVDFLVTKHGLAAVLRSDSAGFDALHAYFLDRLAPVCTQAARSRGRRRRDPRRHRRPHPHARRREPLHRRGQRPPLRRTPTGRPPRRRTAPTALTAPTTGRAAGTAVAPALPHQVRTNPLPPPPPHRKLPSWSWSCGI